jgi:hypothetical protein
MCKSETQWCDNDCGRELIGNNYYTIRNLKHSIATENKGSSAVLCPDCCNDYCKRANIEDIKDV